jgi:hypothetical protein
MNRVLRNIVGATLVLALLIPVPALGLTFLGSWRFFTSNVGGLPTNLTPPGISDSPNDYSLTINMGKVDPPSTTSKYSVTATRDFSISDPSELVRISHSFGTFMQDGNINATMTIQRYGVANDPFNFPPYSFTAPGGFMSNPQLNDFFKQSSLTQGLYRLSLTLTYLRNVNGTSSWNNSSPHVFNFRRVP